MPRTLADLERRLLRPASPDAFRKDPLRLFRLARFACRHPDWQLHPDCLRLAAEVPESALAAIPAERVGRELLKALALPCPGRFLEVLEQLHLWRPWFTELEAIARQIEQVIHHLVDTFSVGNALKNGVPVAIVGETNAGKSTLLNALLNEERAIVSDIHGTTRDVIEDTMN